MDKKELTLTSVKVQSDLFEDFKMSCVKHKFSLHSDGFLPDHFGHKRQFPSRYPVPSNRKARWNWYIEVARGSESGYLLLYRTG